MAFSVPLETLHDNLRVVGNITSCHPLNWKNIFQTNPSPISKEDKERRGGGGEVTDTPNTVNRLRHQSNSDLHAKKYFTKVKKHLK